MGSEGKIALCYAELIKMLWNVKLDLSILIIEDVIIMINLKIKKN